MALQSPTWPLPTTLLLTEIELPYKDKDKQRRYNAEFLARRKAEWLNANGPCVECGSWDNMEVSHKDRTTKVTSWFWSWSAERRQEELDKCEVRCHDCHVRQGKANGDYGWRPAIKIESAVIEEIRRLYSTGKFTQQELADRFECSQTHVSRVTRGLQRSGESQVSTR